MSKRIWPDKVVVNVTEKHIKNGKQKDVSGCALVKAIEDALGTRQTVYVCDAEGIEVCQKNNTKKVECTESLASYRATAVKKVDKFIENFDSNSNWQKVKPFKFILRKTN